MTAMIISASTPRPTPRLFGAARRMLAVAGLSVAAFAAIPAEDAAARGHETLCVAGAVTALNTIVPDTRTREQRVRPRAACRVALNRCENRLDRKRRATGFGFPFARCEVLNRRAVDVRPSHRPSHPGVAGVRYRCVAEAFTRNGRPLSHTRAAEERGRQARACRAAIAQCEDRLDRKRAHTGRGFPHARCEQVRLRRVAALDAPRFPQLGTVHFGYRVGSFDD